MRDPWLRDLREARRTEARKLRELERARERIARLDRRDLERFASRVNAAAKAVARSEGASVVKVWIVKVYLEMAARYQAVTPAGARLPHVKDRLWEAARAELVVLARADLVAAFPAELVRDSEATAPNGARAHFVLVRQ